VPFRHTFEDGYKECALRSSKWYRHAILLSSIYLGAEASIEQKMDSSSGGHLFVNSDQSTGSGSRRNADETSRILSYVQSQRRRREAGKPEEEWKKYTSFITTQENGQADSASRLDATPPLPTARNTTSAAGTPLPQAYPTHNSSDPFHSTVAGNDVKNQEMLRFAFGSITRMSFLAESLAPPAVSSWRSSMRHNGAIQRRLQRCVEDQALMYCTLAYSSSCLAWGLGKIENDRLPEDFLGHAFQQVRLRLAEWDNVADTWTLFSLYSLAITQLWNGLPAMWSKCPQGYLANKSAGGSNPAESRHHLNALLHLITQMGGCSTLDPYILDSVILADKYIAISGMTAPLLDCTWFPNSKPTPDIQNITSSYWLPRLGSQLLQIPMESSLRQIIQDTADCVRIADQAWSAPDLVSAEVEEWLFLRLQALTYRLLSKDSLQGSDNCIRLATLVFLHNAKAYHGGHVASAALAEHLRSALVNTSFEDKTFGPGLQMWCLCTGAMVGTEFPERMWFLDGVVRLASEIQVQLDAETCGRELEKYLYLADRQDDQLHGMIQKLLESSEV